MAPLASSGRTLDMKGLIFNNSSTKSEPSGNKRRGKKNNDGNKKKKERNKGKERNVRPGSRTGGWKKKGGRWESDVKQMLNAHVHVNANEKKENRKEHARECERELA